MEQVTDTFWTLYSGFAGWTVPRITLVTVLVFSVFTTFVLTRFTAGGRLFTAPLCFIVLYVVGLFSNYLGHDVSFGAASEMQKALVLAGAGQMVAGVILLVLLKTGTQQRNRG